MIASTDLSMETTILQGKETAILYVSDTGVGIPPENLAHIFEAYFTTKKGGTGLGLPTTRRIIEEHNGHITVESEPGKGTSFRVELPLARIEIQPAEFKACMLAQSAPFPETIDLARALARSFFKSPAGRRNTTMCR